MKKPQQILREWRKDKEKDFIREMGSDESRLIELIKQADEEIRLEEKLNDTTKG